MTNTIILKNGTGIPPTGALVEGELAIDTTAGKLYTKTSGGAVVEIGAGDGPVPPVITPWVRNPCWLPMPATTAADEQVDLLVCIYPESNYIAMTFACVGGYRVDWGDGTAPVNVATNVAAQYLYDYNNPALAGTNGPVTFTTGTNIVNRTAHGYVNGAKISFAEIVTTTGITPLQTYYVVNATADTFQLSATEGGSVLPLTTNGTGAILPYKQAMVKVIPQNVGATFTTLNLQIKNTTTGLQGYAQPILDATISVNCTTLTVGASTVPLRLLERCTILRHNATSLTSLFNNCASLQEVNLFNTSNVTNISSMFQNCTSLQTVPLLNTQNVISMNSVFATCPNLKLVPLFNMQNVTSTNGMFANCNSLTTVPLFNTVKVLNMGGMFQGCNSLTSVPLFDTGVVTNMQSMFYGCDSLVTVPLFNTQNVTNMGGSSSTFGMFANCNSLETVPLFNTQNVTNMGNMFNGCNSLETVPLFNTQSVTNFTGMFNTCQSLMSVPLFNTANATDTTIMFSSCSSLQTVPLFNTAKVTTFTNMFSQCTNIGSIPAFDTTAAAGAVAFNFMFSNCTSLQQIPDINFNRAAITTSASYQNLFATCPSLSKINLSPGNGPKFTFSVASCKLSAASLNQLYTSLPVVTAQTITVSGNVGIAGDNPQIAIDKGWAVVGS